MANEYIQRGLGISDMVTLLIMPRCSFYGNSYNEKPQKRRGGSNSSFTQRKDDYKTIAVNDGTIVNDIIIVENFLSSMNILHERIHPVTPKEDAHIESFNSILEMEVIGRFEFESFEETESTIRRFVDFYKNARLYMAIGYNTPREMNNKCMENIQIA